MAITFSHKIRLNPSKSQVEAFKMASNTARFSWNLGLGQAITEYELTGKTPNFLTLRKELNAFKGELYPWMYNSPKDACQEPFRDLKKAFRDFFSKKKGYPKFKKKGSKDSFYVNCHEFWFIGNKVKLPRIGKVKIAEQFRFPEGRILKGTISREANKWYLSVSAELPSTYKRVSKPNKIARLGVDLGLTDFAVTSEGECFGAPKPLKRYLRHLARLQRWMSRKLKGSKNREKARMRVAIKYQRIGNIRKDFLHKLSSKICSENQTIVMEELSVQNMMKNRNLARAIADVGWGEFRRQIAYKAPLYGSELVLADKWFPSSKICSKCGNKKESLALSERVYKCAACGEEIDRDLNAALNLKQYIPRITRDSKPVEKLALVGSVRPTKLASVKQELSKV